MLFTVGICLGYLVTRVKKEMQTEIEMNKERIEKRIEKMEKELEISKKEDKQKTLPYTIKY